MSWLFEKIKKYVSTFFFGTDKERELMEMFDYDEYERKICECEKVKLPRSKPAAKKTVKKAKKPVKKVVKSSKMKTGRKTKEK